jgi:hypothetical protein
LRWAAGAVAAVSLLAAVPSAHAANRLTLDPHPATPGHVLLNPPGSAPGSVLVAWTSAAPSDDLAPVPTVCVIPPGGGCTPQTLQPPDGTGADQAIDGLFPVVSGGAVTLVGPRDTDGAAITWTSANGFGAGTLVRNAYPPLTAPEDVLADGASTLIGAVNPGLGLGALGAARGALEFPAPGADVKTSSLALDRNGRPVQAYFNLGDSPAGGDSIVRAFRYTGAGSLSAASSWTKLKDIATGIEPVLSGGPAGLFMVDVDTPPGSDFPTLLDLRKDDGTTFGPPLTLSDDPGAELFDAGAAAQAPGGRLVIVWPQTRTGDGLKVMRLFTSSDGGASFALTDVAGIADGYLDDRNVSAAVGDDGQGAATFVDGGGLELADFTPIAPFAPPPLTATPPLSIPPGIAPPPALVFDPAHGPFATTSVRVGRDVLTLATPRGCVQTGDIVMRLTVRSRKRHGRPRLKIRKVIFRFDGRVRSRRRHPPFSARFHVRVRPGSHHTLTAHTLSTLHGLRVSHTLHNRFTAC